MKARLLFIIMSAALACACSPDSLETSYDFSNYTIDKVVCEASSSYLIADNVSELDLTVSIYTKIGTYKDIYGVQRDDYMEIPRERWRDHDIKFYVNGSQVDSPYKTSGTSPGILQCYAEVDGMRSGQSPAKILAVYEPMNSSESNKAAEGTPVPEYTPDPDPFYFEVSVRAPYTPQKRRIPVIFHIVDLKENVDRGQKLDASVVYNMIDLLNDVYGRKSNTAPNGANANLEFVPAVRNVSNARLAEPGINRVDISKTSDITAAGGDMSLWIWNLYYSTSEEVTKISSSIYNGWVTANAIPVRVPKAFWDPDKYLNIWILYTTNSGLSNDFNYLSSVFFPTVYEKNVFDTEALPIPAAWATTIREFTPEQMAMWKKNPADLRLPPEGSGQYGNKVKGLGQVGIYMNKIDATNYNADIVQYVGAFFGLIPSAPARGNNMTIHMPNNTSTANAAWQDDFCEDTPVYMNYTGPSSTEYIGGDYRIKYTMSAPYFMYRSHNLMERSTFSSSISQDQVKRMQWVLENAAGRQMWKNTSAID